MNLHYFNFILSYLVELIILLLVNFILKKSYPYCTNVNPYFEKGINICQHINLNVLRKFMNLCWATLIAVLGRNAVHGLDSPGLETVRLIKNNVLMSSLQNRNIKMDFIIHIIQILVIAVLYIYIYMVINQKDVLNGGIFMWGLVVFNPHHYPLYCNQNNPESLWLMESRSILIECLIINEFHSRQNDRLLRFTSTLRYFYIWRFIYEWL